MVKLFVLYLFTVQPNSDLRVERIDTFHSFHACKEAGKALETIARTDNDVKRYYSPFQVFVLKCVDRVDDPEYAFTPQ